MSWLGQHIWGFISRFRNKIYIESIETGTSIKVLVRETDGQIKEKDCRCASGDEVQEVKGVEPVSVDNTDPKKPVVSVNDASRTNTGLMSSSDKDKLDGLPNGDTYTTTITGINKGISDNTAVISLNQTNITSNADNIAAQTTNISKNAQDITAYSNNIATNATNITNNSTAIASNSAKVKTNEESIASNSALGANNATTINTIATKVSSVEADVAKNGTTIANNTTAIATNTTAIATKQGTITLTTTGTSGAATLGSKGVLNIPQYAATTTGLSGTFTVLEDAPEKGEKTYAQITLSNGVITRIISVTADQRVDNNLTSPSRE